MASKIKFYNVNKSYVEFLRQAEIIKRGFSKIPLFDYKKNEKFVCGIVLDIHNLKYYAPISSFSEQQQTNILIVDKNNKVLSSIRFCFMFPIPSTEISVKDFSKENEKHKRLLFKEYHFCLKNVDIINEKAFEIHNKVTNNLNPSMNGNCCDFKLLEEKCKEYIAIKKIKKEMLEEAIITKEEINF